MDYWYSLIDRYAAAFNPARWMLLIGLSLLFSFKPAYAQQLQELEISPMEAPATEVVVFLDHPGRVVVIIRSSLTSLNFRSNMEIVDERNNPTEGEYRIVLNPENQILTVSAPGYQSEGIQLRGLQPNDRFYYSVEPVADESENTLPVVIRVTPDDARVTYNGILLDLSRSVPLEPGSHTLSIEREHHYSRTETIDVSTENTFFEFRMEPMREQLLRIRSEPAGAMVYIDGVEEGTTDRTGVLERFRFPGTYDITVLLSGFQNIQRAVEVREVGTNEAFFNLERSTGTLVLRIDPEAAEVTVNRQRTDTSSPLELAPGTYRLEVTRQGYEPHTETVTLERGQRLERTITLQAHMGTLLYRVSPSFAQATLRDRNGNVAEEWTGSRRLEGLPAGEWVLSVTAPDYESINLSVTITHNQTTEVPVELSESRRQTVAVISETDRPSPPADRPLPAVDSVSGSGFSISLISSFINNSTFRSNYNNGYGVQFAYRAYPIPYIFTEINAGYVYHGFSQDHPLYSGDQSIYNLFGGITAGLQVSVSRGVALNVGAGYRSSAYQLPKNTNFSVSESQSFNSFYGEGAILLETPGLVFLQGMGVYLRYGLASNQGNQPLVEYGISLRF